MHREIEIPRRRLLQWASLGAMIPLVSCAKGSSASPAADSSSEVGSHMTRVRGYKSVKELKDDSDVVAIVTVGASRVARDVDDVTDFTLSECRVSRHIKGKASRDASLIVRQLGSSGQATPVPLLRENHQYLLFLTRSGLAAPLDEQFYVTGADAGIFSSSGESGAQFERVARNEVDTLPNLVSDGDVLGA